MYFVTSKCGRQRCRKDQKCSKQIYNAEVLDEHKTDNPILDITFADIEDHATVGYNSNKYDDNNQRTLQCFGKQENFTRGFFSFSETNILNTERKF